MHPEAGLGFRAAIDDDPLMRRPTVWDAEQARSAHARLAVALDD